MKNLIIVKQDNGNLHGLNSLHSGALNLHKDEGGNLSKHGAMKHHSNFFSMLQGDSKDTHHHESRMKQSRMMSSMSPTPGNNNYNFKNRSSNHIQPAKILQEYFNEIKPSRR